MREQPQLLLLVVEERQPLVDPAVDADLVPARRLDLLHHVRVQRDADRGNEKRRRHLMLVEHSQDARQAVHGAVLAARDHFVVERAGRQRGGGVVHVERERHRHARAARPRRRLEPLPGADVEHLLLELVDRQLRARQRIRLRRLRVDRQADPEQDAQQQGEATESCRIDHRCSPRALERIHRQRRRGTTSFADRSVSAANVSVPLVQPAVGSVGAPTTKRFRWSCVRP